MESVVWELPPSFMAFSYLFNTLFRDRLDKAVSIDYQNLTLDEAKYGGCVIPKNGTYLTINTRSESPGYLLLEKDRATTDWQLGNLAVSLYRCLQAKSRPG